MRGAVLRRVMGSDMVKERILRRHYGLSTSVPFREGYHLEALKFEGEDGTLRCQTVDWIANRVSRFLLFLIIRETNFQIGRSSQGPLTYALPPPSMNDLAHYFT